MFDQENSIVLVETVWLSNDGSNKYIDRLNRYLNPKNLLNITTAMHNKEILPNINKTNAYNRFMIVFDYNVNKEYQRCFSYSSPKDKDKSNELWYYKLPSQTKIMLNSSIDVPTEYLIKADLTKMEQKEKEWRVKKNLHFNIIKAICN